MRDFDDSTLWRISAFERFREETAQSSFQALSDNAVIPTTLAAELTALEKVNRSSDVVAVLAACMRQNESALILLCHRDLLWPLTVFPRNNLYHLARPIDESLNAWHRDLRVMAVEPPGLRPPGHTLHERIADPSRYHLLAPLLWAMAMHAPRAQLLEDIAGRAAYRISATFVEEGIALAGALGPVLRRLRREIASLEQIARWPGMDRERAARVLNGAYLQRGLMVLRNHHRAGSANQSRLWNWLGSHL